MGFGCAGVNREERDLPASDKGSRRPSYYSSSRNRRQGYSSRASASGTRAPRSQSAASSAARMKAQREQEAISRKTERSGKAAGKGALLILAVSLIAIKAFSSLPSTVKTSAQKSVGITKVTGSTTTTFAKSVSSTPSSSGITGGSVSPDQVVLPQASPSGSVSGSSSATKPSTVTTRSSSSVSPVVSSSNSLVTVRVFNGTDVAGAAGKFTSQLAKIGYDVVAASNATTQNLSKTSVYYSPGYESQAAKLAAAIGLAASSIKPVSFSTPIPNVQPSDLNVVLGTDKAS